MKATLTFPELMKTQNKKLPNKALAFKLLDEATISQNQQHMCLTSANYLTFKSMKIALKIFFSDKTSTSKDVLNQFESVNFKQEELVFVMLIRTLNLEENLILKLKKGKITRCVI